MRIDATLEIEMFDDQAEEIFVEYLRKEYAEHVRNPLVIVTEDIADNNRVTAAMVELIKYYSTKDEYLEFIKETHGE